MGSYLEEVGSLTNGLYSSGLSSLIDTWANELSYASLCQFIHIVTGCEQLSISGVQSYLLRRAASISSDWASKAQIDTTIEVVETIDVEDAAQPEVLVFMDDVGVKAQKPHKKIARTEADAKRLDTTTVLVESTIKGDFVPLTEGIDRLGQTIYPIPQAIADTLTQLHDTQLPLPIVAITDGARSIRLCLWAVFGSQVRIILDWYHLQLKIKNMMSMIAPTKADKALYIEELGALLWQGHVTKALDYLKALPRVKNKDAHSNLCTYLEKHAQEIINYERRKQQGKAIGSGRGEKLNDTIVAHRQKKKGMAWAITGSKALAVIKTYELQKNREINLKPAA